MKRKGFTLIELMIVVAIIAIIAAIAIPSLLVAKKAGQEAAIIASLRTLSSVQETYHTRFGAYGTLGDLSTNGYIDSVMAAAAAAPGKSGYTIILANLGADTWDATADPLTRGTTGDRGFFIDHSGVIRFDPDGTATVASDPID